MNVSLIEMWGQMGWFVRGIVYVLIFMSLMVIAISIRKILEFRTSRKATVRFSGPFSAALAKPDFVEAENLLSAKQNAKSHVAALFRRVLKTLDLGSPNKKLTMEDVDTAQRIIELNGIEQIANFRRGLGILATTGATAPFVGLLGTVLGVVNAFTGIAASGSGGLAAVSAGIAEALIVTAIGLIVAIPAVWLYNYFVNQVERLSMEVSYTTREFLDYLQAYAMGGHSAAAAAASGLGGGGHAPAGGEGAVAMDQAR